MLIPMIWLYHSVNPVSVSTWYCQVFDIHTSAPSNSVQDHKFSNKLAVYVSKLYVTDYSLRVLVLATELPDIEGIEVHITPLLILLLQQWGVLLMPCCLEGTHLFSIAMVTSMMATFLQMSSIVMGSGWRDSPRLGTAWLILMVVEAGAWNTFTSLPRSHYGPLLWKLNLVCNDTRRAAGSPSVT